MPPSRLSTDDLAEIDAVIADIDKSSDKPAGKLRRLFASKKAKIYASVFTLMLVGGAVAHFMILANRVMVDNNGDGALALQENVDPTQLRGEGDGRINILLIGVGGESHVSGSLADSIILASIDPFSKNVAMLSIPRDLYLEIPGYGYSKINAAHAYGEEYDYPGGGPALLKETVSSALGVPIHYFTRVDFTGFQEGIDTVGGIDVKVEEAIDDYSYPDEGMNGYKHFYLPAGEHHMDGALALKYARSRYTTSDFDRSKRQQKIIMAFKDKALSLGTLANPLKLNELMGNFGNHVQTDLQVNEIMKLAEIAREVSADKVATANLDASPDNYLVFSEMYGASVLVPKSGDFTDIKRYVRSILVDGFIKDEQARIAVLNGTDRAGLANDVNELLRSYGYNVTKVDNAPSQDYTQTVIYDYTNGDKPYTLRYLEQRFGVTAEKRESRDDVKPEIEIILGTDYQAPS